MINYDNLFKVSPCKISAHAEIRIKQVGLRTAKNIVELSMGHTEKYMEQIPGHPKIKK